MVKIAIVYHSKTGVTGKVAHAVMEGARQQGAEVLLMKCLEVDNGYLDAADAVIFGCPTYMGSVPADFKKFMDDSSEAWMERKWCNKIAAGFTNSSAPSGDKLSTLSQIALYAFQHGMVWVGLDIMAGKTEAGATVPLNRLGSWVGLMTQLNNNTDPVLIESDLATAHYFGRRIALQTQKFNRG